MRILALAEQPTEIAQELMTLESELKRLEAEYNMFFGGRLPRPPWETRGRVAALVKRLDRTSISNYGDRFRFNTLQSRFSAFIDLWDRGLRAREEGRAGPFAAPRPAAVREKPPRDEQTIHVTTLKDPMREMDKLRDLYDRLVDARRDAGQPVPPFYKFAELVKAQVTSLKDKGGGEVALRVAVRSGKLALTARPVKGAETTGKPEKAEKEKEVAAKAPAEKKAAERPTEKKPEKGTVRKVAVKKSK